ncbi:MAG: YebC/PmpR family DNA-binding transcriptional regulator [Pseudomonadota bacterium]|nr:YebC/PmpR family DNA-binding transcriptional regulator [Pseudomonadota bacterium]
MAGHSKFKNIQHRKGAQDQRRAKVFTRLTREITVAAQIAGGDLDSNPRLRLAVDRAKKAQMPSDNIKRAIGRGAGGEDADKLEEVIYEGYGPNGVAVMVECLTDNRNRTVAEVRFAFSRAGGNMGAAGSVAYLFSKKGLILLIDGTDEERAMEVAMEAGADDIFINDDGSIDIYTSPEQFDDVQNAIEASGLGVESAELTMIASTEVNLAGDDAQSMLKLLDALEDLDDVQNVHSNADFPQELLEQQ